MVRVAPLQFVAALFGVLAAASACGGQSRGEGSEGTGGVAEAGSSGTGGASAGGTGLGGFAGMQSSGGRAGQGSSGTPAAGIGAGGAPGCVEEAAARCVSSCSESGDVAYNMQCVENRWQCPPNTVPIASCASSACADFGFVCCNPTTGTSFTPDCNQRGSGLWFCPEGTVFADACHIAPGLGCKANARDLDQQQCPLDGAICGYNQPCGHTECTCETPDDGTLLWRCLTNAC